MTQCLVKSFPWTILFLKLCAVRGAVISEAVFVRFFASLSLLSLLFRSSWKKNRLGGFPNLNTPLLYITTQTFEIIFNNFSHLMCLTYKHLDYCGLQHQYTLTTYRRLPIYDVLLLGESS